MRSFESLRIDLKDLKDGLTTVEYDLDDSYFEYIEGPEVRKGNVHVILSIHKVNDFFELNVHTEGIVSIPCDLCLDDMEQPISTDNRLVVRFGDENSDDDEVVTIDEKKVMITQISVKTSKGTAPTASVSGVQVLNGATQHYEPINPDRTYTVATTTNAGMMLAACLPFWPSTTSNVTFWPSLSDLKPSILIAE